MNFKYIVTTLMLTTLSSHLAGMEQSSLPPSLNFSTDQKLVIFSALADRMQFAVPQKEFMGKSMLAVIPLSEMDKINLAAGFNNAAIEKTVKKVPYTLDSKQFTATITPLFSDETQLQSFFVMVNEGL